MLDVKPQDWTELLWINNWCKIKVKVVVYWANEISYRFLDLVDFYI